MALAWAVLVVSGMLEAVWATALEASKGFRRPVPTIIFIISLAVSLLGLAYALESLPVGTAYAVWVGIGAVLTAVWAFVTRTDTITLAKVLLLAALIACVVGLKAVS